MYQQPGDPNAQNQNPYYPPSNPQWPATGPGYTPSGTDQPAYPPPSYYPPSYPPTQAATPPPPYAPQSNTQYSYPGGPGYMPPAPPRKSNSRLLMIIAGIVLVVLIVGGGAYALGHKGATNAPTTPTPAANSNTPATGGNTPAAGNTPAGSTPTSQTSTNSGTVGQAVQAGPDYLVTVNSATTNTGDSVFSPKTGNIYLVVDVTVKNTSSSPQDVSSFLNFELQDSTGQKYDQTFTDIGTPPDQTGLQPGKLIRGQLVYEVPASMHQFTFSYLDLLGDTVLATWNLTD